MEKEQAIDYLENLQEGKFITVNIPIYKETKVQVTAMYVGKDADGGYKFIDSGRFVLTKGFLERGRVTIDKEYNGDVATDIYARFKKEKDLEQKKKQKNSRESR